MSSILFQQFEDHFGDEFERTVKRAKTYIATAMRGSWLSRTAKNKAQSAEGGRMGLLRRCLATIVEVGDVDEGLRTFGNYLQREYGDGKSQAVGDNYNVSLKPWSDATASPTMGVWVNHTPEGTLMVDTVESSLGESSPAGLSEKNGGIDEILRTPEEWELFTTIGDVGGIAEAIRLLGWPKDDAMRIWFRIHQRGKAYQRRLTTST